MHLHAYYDKTKVLVVLADIDTYWAQAGPVADW